MDTSLPPLAVRLRLAKALLVSPRPAARIRLLGTRGGCARLAFEPGVRVAWTAVSGGEVARIAVEGGLGEARLPTHLPTPAVLAVTTGDHAARFELGAEGS